MRLLADECVDCRIIAWLRSVGHDVLAVRDTCRGARDGDVLALARRDDRMLMTEDKDFGELALRSAESLPGIVLLRETDAALQQVLAALSTLLSADETSLRGSLVVVRGARIRVRKL